MMGTLVQGDLSLCVLFEAVHDIAFSIDEALRVDRLVEARLQFQLLDQLLRLLL